MDELIFSSFTILLTSEVLNSKKFSRVCSDREKISKTEKFLTSQILKLSPSFPFPKSSELSLALLGYTSFPSTHRTCFVFFGFLLFIQLSWPNLLCVMQIPSILHFSKSNSSFCRRKDGTPREKVMKEPLAEKKERGKRARKDQQKVIERDTGRCENVSFNIVKQGVKREKQTKEKVNQKPTSGNICMYASRQNSNESSLEIEVNFCNWVLTFSLP